MNRTTQIRTAPALAMTAVSLALTLAVVAEWLGRLMPLPIALLVGAGLDGAWLSVLAYERRMARQGDHGGPVAYIGWGFGLIATAVLVAHALTTSAPAAWLAVSWLPLGAKALWLVHGLWERTELSPRALEQISRLHQDARDAAAVARAALKSQAVTEEIRLEAVTAAGARVARVQAKAAVGLSRAWAALEDTRQSDGADRALASVTCGVTPQRDGVTPMVTPVWSLPRWESAPAIDAASEPALTDDELDGLLTDIRDSENPPLSYREAALRFRAAGHSASEVRLRAAWRRITASQTA